MWAGKDNLNDMCNEKTKKCNKGTLAVLLSILAVVLCLFVFFLWIFETIPHSLVTLDSFIGACVTLLSILVTVGIGWQIFNVVEVKNTMKELKEKQDGVEKQKDELREEIKKVQELAEDNERLAIYLHSKSLTLHATMLNRKDLIFLENHFSLAQIVNLNKLDIDEVNRCLKELSSTLKSINKNIEITQKRKSHFDEINREICESKCYPWIKEKYEDIIAEFMSKVEIKEE